MQKPPIDIHQGFHDVDAAGAGDAFETYLVNLHQSPAWVASRDKRYEMAAFKPGECVLDAGCGIGMDIAELARVVGPSGSIVGFDYSAELLTRAERRAAGISTPISLQQGDLHTLPFADESFDAIWSERVFMYLERPLNALREALRVLRPGGRFISGEIDFAAVWATSPDEDFRAALQRRTMQSVRNPMLARQLPGLCYQAGFSKVAVEPTMSLARDFAYTERAANFAWRLDRMVDDGETTRAAADGFLAAMRAMSDRGEFVSILLVPNLVAAK